MSGQVALHAYRPEDREACLDVWQSASRVGHPFLGEDVLARQRGLVGEVYLPQARTVVAELDGEIVGFIGLIEAFIGGLFVAPSAHGRGIGRRLVLHAAELEGELAVEVYEANRGARAFYERLGFIAASRRDVDDDGLPHPLIRMKRRVDAAGERPDAAPRPRPGPGDRSPALARLEG
jgi:ribosomal protein S18 acetylase RimI-like enzyme